MTEAKREQLLVTFALFAYNQETYIREAVEGAFSQTYEPLEIVLSDDCSSDRTFAIMSEMAAAYRGPHEVRAVRNERNIGVLPHILARGREANGEIVVVAAGDDISNPERTKSLINRFEHDIKIHCVTSAFDLIDQDSKVVARNEKVPIGVKGQNTVRTFLRRVSDPYTVIQGSTASYRRHIFEQVMPDGNLIFPEDNFFNFLIYLLGGRVVQVEDSLVKYRQHSKALSNRDNTKLYIDELEASFHSEAKKRLNMMEAFLRLAERGDRACDVDLPAILAERERSKFVHEWPELSLGGRILSIIRSLVKLRISDVKWKSLRLTGVFPIYQPKAFLCRFLPKYARKRGFARLA